MRLQSRQNHTSCWKIQKLACCWLIRFVSIPNLGVGGGDAGGDSCDVWCDSDFLVEFVGDMVDNSWQGPF